MILVGHRIYVLWVRCTDILHQGEEDAAQEMVNEMTAFLSEHLPNVIAVVWR